MTEAPVERRRSVPRQERLNDLLAAAAETFTRLGVETATVADITRQAGVAKGTFYLYFESKEHVLAALWDRYLEGFLTGTVGSLGGDEAGRDWLAVLDRCVDDLVRHALAHADLHRMVYRSANGRALELCRQANERVIAMLADVVRRADAAGQAEVTAPDETTRFVYHGLHGLLDDVIGRAETAGVPVDPAAMVELARALVHRVLGPGRSGFQHRAQDVG